MQATFGCRAVILNLGNQRAGRFIQAERLGQILIHFLDDHAQPAAADFATALQLIGHIHRHVDRDRERHAHETTGTGVDLRVDADHFTVQVEQRTTGVAWVDRHVGLNERHIVFVRQATTHGTDDALSHGMVEAKRRTDCHDPLTGFQVLGFAEFEHRQVLAFDFQQGHVGAWIGADQLGFHFTAVGEADEDLVGIGDYVVIGQDVAIRGDNEARTQRLRFTLTTTTARRTLLRRHATFEELAQHRRQAFQIRHLLVHFAIRQFLRGTDVHHGWRSLFDQLGEVRQIGRLRRRHRLTEQQHSGENGEIGFQTWYRHTAPVTTSRVKRYGARNAGNHRPAFLFREQQTRPEP
ncbi:hypothetical protein D3C72_960920 [compost metagenome]